MFIVAWPTDGGLPQTVPITSRISKPLFAGCRHQCVVMILPQTEQRTLG
jgi:hypothetical protein